MISSIRSPFEVAVSEQDFATKKQPQVDFHFKRAISSPPFLPEKKQRKNPQAADNEAFIRKELIESLTRCGVEISQFYDAETEGLEKVIQLMQAIEEADFTSPIWGDAKYPYYAAWGVAEGRIDYRDFSTLMLYWELSHGASAQEGVEPISYYSDKLSGIRAELFYEVKSSCKKGLMISQDLLDRFDRELSLLKPFQHHFFIYKDSLGGQEVITPKKYYRKQMPILPVLKRTGKVVFSHFELDAQRYRIIPSHGIKQAFLNTLRVESPILLKPMINFSPISSIAANASMSMRDEIIPFPGVEVAKEADYFEANIIDANYHDFYHSIVASFVPSSDRLQFKKNYEVLAKLSLEQKDASIAQIMTAISHGMIDMEHMHMGAADPSTAYEKSVKRTFSVSLSAIATDQTQKFFADHPDSTEDELIHFNVVAKKIVNIYQSQKVFRNLLKAIMNKEDLEPFFDEQS